MTLINSLSFITKPLVWLLIIGLIFLATCRPFEPLGTPVSVQNTISSEIVVLTVTTPLETVTSTITLTPSATATLPPSPPTTNTTTPTPTVSPLQKVAELPIYATNFAISRDSTLLATVDKNTGILYVYDTTNWQIKWKIEEENRGMTGYILDFSPDGNFMAGGGTEQDVFVWDMATGKTTYILSEPYDTVNSVSFSSDGKFLAVSAIETHSSPYRVMVWDMSTGQLTDQFRAVDYGWYIENSIFVPSQANLLAMTTSNFRSPEEFEEGHRPGGLYFWSIDNQQIQEAFTGTRGSSLATSPNGQLVTSYIDGFLRVWDMQDQIEVLNIATEKTAEPWNISLTDAGIIASLDTQWVLTIWNLEGELLGTLVSDNIISDIGFTSSGELLIAYLADNTPIEVWLISE